MQVLVARLRHPMTTVRGIQKELAGARRHASDSRSLLRLSADILLYRVLRVFRPSPRWANRCRTVRLDGASITYRLNRGDIQGIREVWLEQAYRLPPGSAPSTVLDLGANIGLASVWLAKTYRCAHVVGVEPDPANVQLARHNMTANSVTGQVIEAAVGPVDGEAPFVAETDSNVGRVHVQPPRGRSPINVAVRTPRSIMIEASLDWVDLCKLDVEGAEGPVFLDGDTAWLTRVGSVIAELHANLIDAHAVSQAIEGRGLQRHRPGDDGVKLEFFAAVDHR